MRHELHGFHEMNLPAALQRAGGSATRARRVTCRPFAGTNERGQNNRRSPDEADSTPAASAAGSSRQPERRRAGSRVSHRRGWFRQRNNRLNPVGAVSRPGQRVNTREGIA